MSTGDEPCAVGYELQSADRPSFVPISAQMALSGEILVLSAEATAFVRNDLAGFGAAIASCRSPELEKPMTTDTFTQLRVEAWSRLAVPNRSDR